MRRLFVPAIVIPAILSVVLASCIASVPTEQMRTWQMLEHPRPLDTAAIVGRWHNCAADTPNGSLLWGYLPSRTQSTDSDVVEIAFIASERARFTLRRADSAIAIVETAWEAQPTHIAIDGRRTHGAVPLLWGISTYEMLVGRTPGEQLTVLTHTSGMVLLTALPIGGASGTFRSNHAPAP